MTFDWGKIREGWKVRRRRGGGKRWGEGEEMGRGGEGEAIIVDDLDVDDKEAICYH